MNPDMVPLVEPLKVLYKWSQIVFLYLNEEEFFLNISNELLKNFSSLKRRKEFKLIFLKLNVEPLELKFSV